MTTPLPKPVHLYNTLTRKKDLFQPLKSPHVTIYSCGPTVYRDIHIGNFRTFMMTDWLRRMLTYNGYDVYLVRNITDVGHLQNDTEERGEDKIEHAARTSGRSAYEIADFYTQQYLADQAELNILSPHLTPKATEHIPEMITIIEQLLEQGLAYTTNGNVYYAVSKFGEYGKLSGNTVENLRTGGHGRQQMEVAEDKRAPEDFALWKHGAEDRQMNWPSPWGVGFPGWHIECSAMATKYLGEQFDIHTGGIDLVFPHHEDEIAQSQGASGKYPVQIWMHGEFLVLGHRKMNAARIEQSEEAIKMSRSKGNVILVSTLKEWGIDPIAYRYLLLTAHYRSKLNFTEESITAAQNGLDNLRADLASLPPLETSDRAHGWSPEAGQVYNAFRSAISNDLDLPTALSITREVARNQAIAAQERHRLLLDFDQVLGLGLDTVETKEKIRISNSRMQGVDQSTPNEENSMHSKPSEKVLTLVRERDIARAARDWQRSDELRDQLKALGYEVRDTANGTELV